MIIQIHKIQKYLIKKFNILFIIFLYCINYKVCDYFFENDIVNFYKLKYTFYCAIIILCLKYKNSSPILEDFLIALILNNVYEYYKDSLVYSVNDIIFITSYIFIKNVHYLARNYRKLINRINNFFSNIIQKK